MARWCGQEPPPFTGTKNGVTVYRLRDPELYYVRLQSSITGKRIKKDPVFKGFRNSAVRLRDGSRIASKIYRLLPVKKHSMYREITGKAILMLKGGLKEDVITDRLMNEYLPKPKPIIKRKRTSAPKRFYQTLHKYKSPAVAGIYLLAPG
jgi:hypothetical protein